MNERSRPGVGTGTAVSEQTGHDFKLGSSMATGRKYRRCAEYSCPVRLAPGRICPMHEIDSVVVSPELVALMSERSLGTLDGPVPVPLHKLAQRKLPLVCGLVQRSAIHTGRGYWPADTPSDDGWPPRRPRSAARRTVAAVRSSGHYDYSREFGMSRAPEREPDEMLRASA